MAASVPAPGGAGDPLALEDPEGTMRYALAGRDPPGTPAEDVLLAWVLRLPDGVEPARAALRLLAGAEQSGNQRLRSLLAEVARWPRRRLARLRQGRRTGHR